ncbi:MAG: succinylglutamate desuccinylase/aspartoacylase family protein [Rhizobacter sp.]
MTHLLRTHGFKALQPGKRLVVLGAVHGNETCGTRAIERILPEIDSGAIRIVRGSVTFVPVTNPLAYERRQRAGDRNLNRNLRPNSSPQDYEDRIANVLCPLLAEHEVLLDLHSFHTAGEPFAMIGPADNSGTLEPFSHAAAEEALALRLGPRRIVEGWLDTYAAGVAKRLQRTAPSERAHLLSTDPSYGVGTTEYMRTQGGYAITLECGQHNDAKAPEVGYRAIRATLAQLGLVDEPAPPARTDLEFLRLAEVTDLHDPADRFAKAWASYDPLRAGELIGTRADGTELRAPADGFIVFPNPAALPGNEWFYFALKSSRALRA